MQGCKWSQHFYYVIRLRFIAKAQIKIWNQTNALAHNLSPLKHCTCNTSAANACMARRDTHLNCWCSLELRILEENLSASFSKLREYSSSISALRRKNSCRSCSSWIRDSDCCSKHLNCSTSWLRISVHQNTKQKWYESTVCTAVTTVHNMIWSKTSCHYDVNVRCPSYTRSVRAVGWFLHWYLMRLSRFLMLTDLQSD